MFRNGFLAAVLAGMVVPGFAWAQPKDGTCAVTVDESGTIIEDASDPDCGEVVDMQESACPPGTMGADCVPGSWWDGAPLPLPPEPPHGLDPSTPPTHEECMQEYQACLDWLAWQESLCRALSEASALKSCLAGHWPRFYTSEKVERDCETIKVCSSSGSCQEQAFCVAILPAGCMEAWLGQKTITVNDIGSVGFGAGIAVGTEHAGASAHVEGSKGKEHGVSVTVGGNLAGQCGIRRDDGQRTCAHGGTLGAGPPGKPDIKTSGLESCLQGVGQ